MITDLHLRGFKGWADTGPLKFARITGFFGPNSSGKSALIQALLMLKQTADSPDRNLPLFLGDDRSLVELGGFHEVTHRHDTERGIEWDISWRLPKQITITDPTVPSRTLFSTEQLSQFARVTQGGAGLRVERMGYRIDNLELGMQAREKQGYDLFPSRAEGRDFHFVRTRGRAWPLPPPTKCYGFPPEVRAYYQNAQFLADLELAAEHLWGRVFYLGPLREYPRRHYIWAGGEPLDVGRRGERVTDALLSSRARGKYISPGPRRHRRTLEEQVASSLADLGIVHKFEIESVAEDVQIYRMMLQTDNGGPLVPVTDVGFGVSQVLPVITLCYYVPEGSVVILEQPEIHLHPAVQAGLADVLIDAVKTRRIQVILESHSEHLLRRLQRRMAEGKIDPEQEVALYFVHRTGRASDIQRLLLDLFGRISNWPPGFFGDDLGEVLATQAAILRQKGADAQGG